MSSAAADKKSESNPQTASGAPLAAAPPPDMIATGPAMAGLIGRRPQDKQSEKELAAAALRKKVGHVVETLMTDKASPLRRPAACLMTSHMLAELGEAKAAKMTPADVQDYTARFRAKLPAAWGAVSQQNYINFVRHLQLGGIRDVKEDRSEIVKEYQSTTSMLLVGI